MNSRDLSVQTTRLLAVEPNRAERVSLGRPAELRHIPMENFLISQRVTTRRFITGPNISKNTAAHSNDSAFGVISDS